MVQNEEYKSWRSIVTLIVFILTNLIVVFPFALTIPKFIVRPVRAFLAFARILPRPIDKAKVPRVAFPFNFVTAPFVSVLFLLALGAIGREEVKNGIIGANGIIPIDIMAFFLTLAYLAISIDTAGLVRVSAFWVLRKGGKYGHRLYFYLYTFFFCLGTFIGNDPIILSGTAFLAYMTRAASNILNPRAWIHAQFAIANISSAILVSSNPTNLVLAGAFDIKFVVYTVNMIVPTVVTAIVLFPFLLYIIFANEDLIPLRISIHEHPDHEQSDREQSDHGQPVEQTPGHRWTSKLSERDLHDLELRNQLPLEEVLDPYMEKFGAIFGAVLFALTLVAILVTNALHVGYGVFIITVPAAFMMLCRDLIYDWCTRKRKPMNGGPQATKNQNSDIEHGHDRATVTQSPDDSLSAEDVIQEKRQSDEDQAHGPTYPPPIFQPSQSDVEPQDTSLTPAGDKAELTLSPQSVNGSSKTFKDLPRSDSPSKVDEELVYSDSRGTLYGFCQRIVDFWDRVPFHTVKTIISHLPFALVPFAFCMFIIVEGLVTKGWVEILAEGWAIWTNKSNPAVAIAGMGFVSVCLCNFAGTNIGATILLSRVLQAWLSEHTPSERMVHGTIYALALGVNYGAFSVAFSASLAGMLWRDILERKHIMVRRLDFARINVPIIAISMTVGCAVLVGQVYLFKRGDVPLCTNPNSSALVNGICP